MFFSLFYVSFFFSIRMYVYRSVSVYVHSVYDHGAVFFFFFFFFFIRTALIYVCVFSVTYMYTQLLNTKLMQKSKNIHTHTHTHISIYQTPFLRVFSSKLFSFINVWFFLSLSLSLSLCLLFIIIIIIIIHYFLSLFSVRRAVSPYERGREGKRGITALCYKVVFTLLVEIERNY